MVAEASAAVLREKGSRISVYYTPEQIRHHAAALARGPHGEELRTLQREWRELLRDVHATLSLPPESPEAQALAARWDAIHERARPVFADNEKLWQSLSRAHLDGQYDDIEDGGHAEDYAFIRRVKMHRLAATRRLGSGCCCRLHGRPHPLRVGDGLDALSSAVTQRQCPHRFRDLLVCVVQPGFEQLPRPLGKPHGLGPAYESLGIIFGSEVAIPVSRGHCRGAGELKLFPDTY
jgi:TipAS antibiotic-recognition domain